MVFPDPAAPDNFAAFILAPGLWLAGWVAISIYVRRRRGLPVLGGRPPNPLFFEGSVSGYSRKNLFTELFRANGCLRVFVTDEVFGVAPFFPFNLMFLPDVGDLEHYLPRRQVTLEIGRRFMLSTPVRASFPMPDGTVRSLQLMLKNPAGLQAALASP